MNIEVLEPTQKSGTNGAHRTTRKIPDYLVRETIDGIRFYYPGYRAVLNKTKTLEDIMPDSTFQGSLKTEIGYTLRHKLDPKQYRVIIGEAGLHLQLNENMGLDVAVFDKGVLTRDKINAHYADVAAELVVEIDLNVELPEKEKDLFTEYIVRKTKRLLAFGTKKVVWYLSSTRQILVAENSRSWQLLDWSEPVELMPGISVEIYLLMEAAEITPPRMTI